jgi:hypothetical protein
MAATEKVRAEPVANMADHGAPDRSHHANDREHAEGRKKLGDRILVRKEMAADGGGKIAVHGKVVPFEHIADHARGDHPAWLRRIHPRSPTW